MANLGFLGLGCILMEGEHLPFVTQRYILTEDMIGLEIDLSAGMQYLQVIVIRLMPVFHGLVVFEDQSVDDETDLEWDLEKLRQWHGSE